MGVAIFCFYTVCYLIVYAKTGQGRYNLFYWKMGEKDGVIFCFHSICLIGLQYFEKNL